MNGKEGEMERGREREREEHIFCQLYTLPSIVVRDETVTTVRVLGDQETSPAKPPESRLSKQLHHKSHPSMTDTQQ